MRAQFGFRFAPGLHRDILRDSKKYSLSVYVSSLLNLLPPTLLPLIVVHKLGAASAAYYYMAFTMATVLYTIAYATMQSVFAEGSHDETAIKAHLAKAAKLIAFMLIPAVLITVLLSGFILKIFGGEYAEQGAMLLRLFAISSIAVAVYSAMGTIFKIVKNLAGVIAMNIVYAVVILGLSYSFISKFGINTIGWAWIAGNIAAVLTGLIFLKKSNHLV
jgi:O-antigen/teichoic acid export membrane protein